MASPYVPNTDNLTANLLNLIQNRQQTNRQDELLKQKLSREQDREKLQVAAAQAINIRNMPDYTQKRTAIIKMAQNAINNGGDPTSWEKLLDFDQQQVDELNVALSGLSINAATAGKMIDKHLGGASAGEREFEQLIKDMPPEDQKSARRIKAGLDPRAVGSAAQTITDRGTAEEVGDSQAIIRQREKFGEMTGSSRAKTIDKGFVQINKIDQGVANIDAAIKAIDDGAKSGPLISKYTPTLRAQTKRLEQIKNLMALDVLNAATFGALSEKELEVVQETAMPDLPPDELKEWLQLRKDGELKLKAYYQEQINFLDQGGSIAGFLRMKRREAPQETDQAQQQATQPAQDDNAALEWARANPNDPRAIQIMQIQGVQ